jgi:hypothetical protein
MEHPTPDELDLAFALAWGKEAGLIRLQKSYAREFWAGFVCGVVAVDVLIAISLAVSRLLLASSP